jgi:hypothetical protein
MISVQPAEGGTIRIVGTFFDSAGDQKAPKTLSYSLYGATGIVNSKEDVSLVPALTNTVILSGDDLLLEDGDFRKIVFEGTYDSATDGNDLPLGKQCETFEIEECSNA